MFQFVSAELNLMIMLICLCVTFYVSASRCGTDFFDHSIDQLQLFSTIGADCAVGLWPVGTGRHRASVRESYGKDHRCVYL